MHEIIATDYNNYAVIYGCDTPWWGLGLFSWRNVNVLSRRKVLESSYMREVKESLMNVDYSYNFWLADRPFESCD